MTGLQRVSFKKSRERRPRLSAPYVPGRRHERFWTEAERNVVRKYYPTGGVAACQAHLLRRQSALAIYNQAHAMGLRYLGSKKHERLKLPANIDARILAAWPLLDGKKRGAVNALALELKVPRWWLSKAARRLGLTLPHRKEPPWTAAELALMRRVPLHDPDRCAKTFREHGFRRSPTAIVIKAKRLEMSRRFRETLSARAAAKILGIDDKTFTRHCIAGDVKTARRGTKRLPQQGGDAWSIAPADLRQFVLDHIERIDLRKVDKLAFVQLIAGEALR